MYSVFSGANFSKYLVKESRKGGKIAAFLKPCDTYSFNQLLKEHRIWRDNVYVVGIACDGMCDIEKIRAAAEVFLKVAEAKRMLETGEATTVHEAAKAVDISRSAFYKYRGCVSITSMLCMILLYIIKCTKNLNNQHRVQVAFINAI